MPLTFHAAVDLGAGSGRVLAGAIDDRVRLREVHRFSYAPRRVAGHLRWDSARLFDGLRAGLRAAAAAADAEGGVLRTAGVDSWGVDYALVDAAGRLVEEPICYRDERTGGMMEHAFSAISREAIFAATGIQFMPINTLYQLMAHVEEGLPPGAARLLMIPDLCHHALCGSLSSELTNASTTQMLRLDTADWDDGIFSALGLPRGIMPPLARPGSELGRLRDDIRRELDLPDLAIIAPATHDTGSAVVGAPLEDGWAYISSGTWSLVGVERRTPLVNGDVLAANFTNERGVDGTFRFLKNVAGLWLLECCRNEWQAAGAESDIARLVAGAAALPSHAGFVYADAPRFFNPRSMVAELRQALSESGQPAPVDPAAFTRVILDSLALRYAEVVGTIESLTGERIPGIHIVGGGALNDYLNQATANATGRPVVAGPVEATGVGNIVMQAVAGGNLTVAEARHKVRETFQPRRYEPRDSTAWEAVREGYKQLERVTT
jgi:rhamnulokinase